MKKPENAQDVLRELFNAARSSGRVHTQKEFADLLGINRSVLSTLMQGSAPITEQMMKRISDACIAAGIVNADSGSAVNYNSPQATATTSDPRWFELVAEKDRQIDRLLCIIENMQK